MKLVGIGKRFNRNWIFRNLNAEFNGEPTVILGPNGSGKSTLLRIIAGQLETDEGEIDGIKNDHYKHVTYCAPYIDVPDEFTFEELLHFQSKFKSFRPNYNAHVIIEKCGLTQHSDKSIKHFSSGMKQRVKLSLAFFFESKYLLLDEPTSHLDETGISWYQEIFAEMENSSQIIVGSNTPHEYANCHQKIALTNFQK
ncbi:MAG: ATP-binding cassette domain-containing protein [Bacteroidetes bacterium]|nr:ATP-binding cassette domain-containing protein [Bacteroidota bacterium]